MKFVKHVRVWVALGAVSMSMGCAGEADVPAEPRPQAQQTVQALEILEPTVDLSTYTVYTVAERQGHPEAGEPEYAFLATGLDALKVDGPLLAADSGLFVLDGAGIQKHPEARREDSPYTFRVTVNPRLSFDVKMYDYDHEVALAAVKLIPQGASFQSVFVFSTSQVDEGVAHDLVITPFIDGVAGTPTAPVSLESRFVASAPLEFLNPMIDLSAYTQYEYWELTGNPEAQNPWEPYLQGGVQAAKVEGPLVDLEPGLFVFDGASIQKHLEAGSPGAPYVFRVTVNPRLSFDVTFSAYHQELDLAGVRIFTRGPSLDSVFIFSGSPVAEGVARKLVITPFIDGVAGTPTWPMTIESGL
ncbi:hypothetical protein SAMN05444354_10436 [Stigmatella aurantiaca]|uniref:Lipoprotein n=1 Tax=Stigmatella aurantiaca TaxID=41 RepID=A0A1H7MNP2_STIAU|nr:hypothetical protein [Stigmatella aurantiaca]SEL12227.1 hypothetical protein SAMN05444354_10436 [Stigmatella aurantiaca]